MSFIEVTWLPFRLHDLISAFWAEMANVFGTSPAARNKSADPTSQDAEKADEKPGRFPHDVFRDCF